MRHLTLAALPALLSVMAGAAACQSSGLLVAAAKRVAAAYVAADTVGRARAADSLVNWRDCDFDPGTDYLQVTTAARLTDAVVRGDTVDVTIEYDVIGRAWSEDHKRAGENNWRFAAGRLTDKLVLHVLPPSRGRPPIACGEYQANHIALSRMGGEISRMDDASRTALEQAKRASK